MILLSPLRVYRPLQVIASRQENKTSMCVDVLKSRQSEVDFINGRVVALAKK